MAHFARVNENNIVCEIMVLSNNDVGNLPFPESEPVGLEKIPPFLGTGWKQTSYNNNFRFRFAGIGFEWHPECGEHGGFCPAKPYDDWIFDTDQCLWIAPVPMPTGDYTAVYEWDPEIHNWKLKS